MENKDNLIRIYPGVRKDQKKFIQEEARKKKVGDGEMHRIIIDFYITTNKPK